MMKVSFDFDGTLEIKALQEYAKKLVKDGIEVHIVTSRFGDDEKYKDFFKTNFHVSITNKDLFEVAGEIGIPGSQVHFTNMLDKYKFFLENPDFVWHIDDDNIENELIRENTKIKTIDIFANRHWKRYCQRYLKAVR